MEEMKYRTIVPRFCACFVDMCVFIPLTVFMNWIWAHYQDIPLMVVILVYILSTASYYLYSIYFLGKYGQTPGKMLLKIKVFDISEMSHITYYQALKRDIVPLVATLIQLPFSIYQIINGTYISINPHIQFDTYNLILLGCMLFVAFTWFALDILTAVFSSKHRAIHDFIAGSVVVKV